MIRRHSQIAHAAYFDLLTSLKDEAVADLRGTPTRVERKGKIYWYDSFRVGSEVRKTYIGEDSDEIRARLARHGELAALRAEAQASRARLIRILRAEGFLGVDASRGALLNAFAQSGVFRLGGTIVGTQAFRLLETADPMDDDEEFAPVATSDKKRYSELFASVDAAIAHAKKPSPAKAFPHRRPLSSAIPWFTTSTGTRTRASPNGGRSSMKLAICRRPSPPRWRTRPGARSSRCSTPPVSDACSPPRCCASVERPTPISPALPKAREPHRANGVARVTP